MLPTLTIIDFAEMTQPYHAKNAAAMTIVHNSQKMCIVTSVPIYSK